jgi:ribose transport system substrate-binding protein
MRGKAAVAAVFAATAAVTAIGAGTALAGETKAPAPVRIAYFETGTANTYVQATIQGMKKAAKEQGATITLFDSKFTPETQFQQCQDAVVAKKYDAFVFLAAYGPAVVPCVKQAIKAGIEVVGINNPLGGDFSTIKPQVSGLSGTVLRPTTTYASLFVETVYAACAKVDPCKVGYIGAVPTFPLDATTLKTFEATLPSHPTVKLVAKDFGQFSRDLGLKAAQNMLQANPDITVLASNGDQQALGAEQAAKAAGSKAIIIGVGASTPGVKAVTEGRWYGSLSFLPFDEGYIGGMTAIKSVRKQKVATRFVDPVTARKLPGVLTRANAAQWKAFKGQWQG